MDRFAGFQIDFTAKSQTHISFSARPRKWRRFRTNCIVTQRERQKPPFCEYSRIMIRRSSTIVSGALGFDDSPQNSPRLHSQVTYEDGSTRSNPRLAVIYNITPLYKKGIKRAGQRIAVAGRSTFNMQESGIFRFMAGYLQGPKMCDAGSMDPGSTNDIGEALLDVEYAGAAAPDHDHYVYGTAGIWPAAIPIDQ